MHITDSKWLSQGSEEICEHFVLICSQYYTPFHSWKQLSLNYLINKLTKCEKLWNIVNDVIPTLQHFCGVLCTKIQCRPGYCCTTCLCMMKTWLNNRGTFMSLLVFVEKLFKKQSQIIQVLCFQRLVCFLSPFCQMEFSYLCRGES